MPKKQTRKTSKPVRPQLGEGVQILNAGSVLEDPITRTLETNYMPYAMSVIVSRALPEIDGFKPAHRKLLYTMYGMGLLKGARTKSANIVGATMHLNALSQSAIYDTMVRMGRGNESLLVPYVDSKGNFGKAYSRDMSCAAARYTEARLEPVCEELFRDIDKETVDFVPNYDGTTTEPTLLPVTFPTILANNTLGIAVGMACNICSFNLAELCATTVALLKDPNHDIGSTMPAPDFVGGGQILYDAAQMRDIFETGRGSVKVRARWRSVPGENMIEITQIPPTTTVEAIMDKIAELAKAGKLKELSDMRDETDLNGLKLTLDLKRGVDHDRLMAKLFPADAPGGQLQLQLQHPGLGPAPGDGGAGDPAGVDGLPDRMRPPPHLLRPARQGKAAASAGGPGGHPAGHRQGHLDHPGDRGRGRGGAQPDDRLRHRRGPGRVCGRDPAAPPEPGVYPQAHRRDRGAETGDRRPERHPGQARPHPPDHHPGADGGGQKVRAAPPQRDPLRPARRGGRRRRGCGARLSGDGVLHPEGYLKKITPQSLRTAGAHKLKEGDEILVQAEARNNLEALFFTDRHQVYKTRLAEFEDGKVSQMGVYLPTRLGMEEGETPIAMVLTADYSGWMLFFFASGKCAKVPLASYATKQNRRKLLRAYSDKEPLAALLFLPEEQELAIRTSAGRLLLVGSAQIAEKATRTARAWRWSP